MQASNMKFANAIPTSFSHTGDLTPLLQELDLHIDRVMTNIQLMQTLRRTPNNRAESEDHCEHVLVMKLHAEILEMDLAVIKLDAEQITEEKLETWVAGDPERGARQEIVEVLMEKMRVLEVVIADVKIEFLNDAE
jgi:hypothetical protein